MISHYSIEHVAKSFFSENADTYNDSIIGRLQKKDIETFKTYVHTSGETAFTHTVKRFNNASKEFAEKYSDSEHNHGDLWMSDDKYVKLYNKQRTSAATIAILKQKYGFDENLPNEKGETPARLLEQNPAWSSKSTNYNIKKAFRDYNRPKLPIINKAYDYVHEWHENPLGQTLRHIVMGIMIGAMGLLAKWSDNNKKKIDAKENLVENIAVKTNSDMDKTFQSLEKAVEIITDNDINVIQQLDSTLQAKGICAEVFCEAEDSTSVLFDANSRTVFLNFAYNDNRTFNTVQALNNIQNNPDSSFVLKVK